MKGLHLIGKQALQVRIDNIESEYPGYDEYQYHLDEIGHNPFTLASYLTAKATGFILGLK